MARVLQGLEFGFVKLGPKGLQGCLGVSGEFRATDLKGRRKDGPKTLKAGKKLMLHTFGVQA